MKTNELLLVENKTGAFDPERTLLIQQSGKTHVPISVSITDGTATVEIRGRNTTDDEWVVLAEVEETDAPLVQWMPQISARLTDAAAADVRVSAPADSLVLEPLA